MKSDIFKLKILLNEIGIPYHTEEIQEHLPNQKPVAGHSIGLFLDEENTFRGSAYFVFTMEGKYKHTVGYETIFGGDLYDTIGRIGDR